MSDKNISNINDLRGYLADELNRIRNKTSNPKDANAAANVAGKIISSIKLELEYNRMAGTVPAIDFIRSREELREISSVSKETGEIEFKKDENANT